MKGKYGKCCAKCCSWRKSARGYRSGASRALRLLRRPMARGKVSGPLVHASGLNFRIVQKRKHRPAPAARGDAGPKKDARDRDDGWVDSLTNARFDAYYKVSP